MFAQGIVIDTVTGIGIVVASGTVIAFLFKLLLGAKDAQIEAEKKRADAEAARAAADREAERLEQNRLIADLESRKKSHEEIASEALKSAREMANYLLRKEGKPPLVPVAPVISESQSPSTAKQREDARIATQRAEMAQIKLEVGQEARVEPEPDDPVAVKSEPSPDVPPEGIELKVEKIVTKEIQIEGNKP